MSVVVLDESKIDSLVSSYEKTEKLIFAGSDEHLDIILDIQSAIKELTDLSIEVSNDLEKSFNDLTQDQAKNIVLKLSFGLRNARLLIANLKKFHPLIFNGIKTCLKDLVLETNQIDEFVHDLMKYKINQPEEIKSLLNDIK